MVFSVRGNEEIVWQKSYGCSRPCESKLIHPHRFDAFEMSACLAYGISDQFN
jgi:hypothetical protein